jgi:hypothetical protein
MFHKFVISKQNYGLAWIFYHVHFSDLYFLPHAYISHSSHRYGHLINLYLPISDGILDYINY